MKALRPESELQLTHRSALIVSGGVIAFRGKCFFANRSGTSYRMCLASASGTPFSPIFICYAQRFIGYIESNARLSFSTFTRGSPRNPS